MEVPTTGLLARNNFQLARYPPLDVRFGRELNLPSWPAYRLPNLFNITYSEQNVPDIRKESDGPGGVEVPTDKLWSVQTQRSLELIVRRPVEK
jgi:hypothetical protein